MFDGWGTAKGSRKKRQLGTRASYDRRDTIRSTYIIATFHSKCKKRIMSDHGKRSVQVNVRLSEEDFALIKESRREALAECGIEQFGNFVRLGEIGC